MCTFKTKLTTNILIYPPYTYYSVKDKNKYFIYITKMWSTKSIGIFELRRLVKEKRNYGTAIICFRFR